MRLDRPPIVLQQRTHRYSDGSFQTLEKKKKNDDLGIRASFARRVFNLAV